MQTRTGVLLIPMVVLTITLSCTLASASARTTLAQIENGTPKTVWDGVFNQTQAARGREAYAVHCSSCHTNDFRGLGAPPLEGEKFVESWREDSLSNLFTFIQTKMPFRAASSLSDETYLDIVAHLLAVNKFPAGREELKKDTLGGIQIVGRNGPAPLPKFALIEVVGCLARDPGTKEWTLMNVSTPVRSRSEDRPPSSELQAFAGRPPGTETLRLVYVNDLRPDFLPEYDVGHKVYGKGYLLRNDKGTGLSVLWLEPVASVCME